MGRKGKLEKFEGDYAPGKAPVKVIKGVGDSVGLGIDDALKLLRMIDQAMIEILFPNNSIAAAPADPLRYEILILATSIDRQLRALSPMFDSLEAAEKDWRKKQAGTSENARKGVRT